MRYTTFRNRQQVEFDDGRSVKAVEHGVRDVLCTFTCNLAGYFLVAMRSGFDPKQVMEARFNARRRGARRPKASVDRIGTPRSRDSRGNHRRETFTLALASTRLHCSDRPMSCPDSTIKWRA
ncbi:hypothetical protein [Bradyrhizobium sp. CCBAU 53421]|uniref:hypothetical protein n=1 Tax=Bradyrhizobium sp. CCBAU 53421 TaxID=1325120 RepID=UPI00188BFD33|nr:hypothetical protein [Bradyrhizobium sp. CCBAU 53421]